MEPPKPASEKTRILINKLTVDDARRLLQNEGGPLGGRSFVIQLVLSFLVYASTARAILLGQVTSWHMLLPLLAQYAGLLVAIPVCQIILPHPELKKEAGKSLMWWVAFIFIWASYCEWLAHGRHITWGAAARLSVTTFWDWVRDANMVLPTLAAFLNMCLQVPRRVRNLHRLGPPFVGVSVGCALRVALPMFFIFIYPIFDQKFKHFVWWIWLMLVASDLLALWLHWDVTTRLARYDQEAKTAIKPADERRPKK